MLGNNCILVQLGIVKQRFRHYFSMLSRGMMATTWYDTVIAADISSI